MRRHGLIICLLIAGCAHAPVKPTPPTLEEATARAQKALHERVKADGWYNLSVGVVVDDQLVYTEGFGPRDPATQEPVTARTLFRLASLTKLFTGMAVLQLRDQGKLDLDDPVSKYLPEIDGVVYPTTEHPPIRIRHLVTHTSGLPRDGSREAGMSEADLLKSLSGMALEFTPGSDQSYSNFGMALVGVVVARASGMPYREYMQRFVFEPLGMRDAVWQVTGAPEPVATGVIFDKPTEKYRPIDKELIEGAMEPAGGLYSNISDMAKFAAFEMSAWPPRNAEEHPPLARSSLRESQLTAGPVIPGGSLPGVNWFVQRATGVGQLDVHSGSLPGYRSEIALLPRRHVGVIALTSDGSGRADLDAIINDALEAFAPTREEPSTPPSAEVQAAAARLISWFQHPDRESARAVFTAGFIEALPHFTSDTADALAKNGGECQLQGFAEGGVSKAEVTVHCRRSPWTFHIQISSAPPHLITGWWW
jgi:CubicO group peptidase (beta-lactamase class C family)